MTFKKYSLLPSIYLLSNYSSSHKKKKKTRISVRVNSVLLFSESYKNSKGFVAILFTFNGKRIFVCKSGSSDFSNEQPEKKAFFSLDQTNFNEQLEFNKFLEDIEKHPAFGDKMNEKMQVQAKALKKINWTFVFKEGDESFLYKKSLFIKNYNQMINFFCPPGFSELSVIIQDRDWGIVKIFAGICILSVFFSMLFFRVCTRRHEGANLGSVHQQASVCHQIQRPATWNPPLASMGASGYGSRTRNRRQEVTPVQNTPSTSASISSLTNTGSPSSSAFQKKQQNSALAPKETPVVRTAIGHAEELAEQIRIQNESSRQLKVIGIESTSMPTPQSNFIEPFWTPRGGREPYVTYAQAVKENSGEKVDISDAHRKIETHSAEIESGFPLREIR